MEADSTTSDNSKKCVEQQIVPFRVNPGNLKVFQELILHSEDKSLEKLLIERLQNFGLLPKSMKCPSDKPDCQLICKPFRVKDKMQWSCEGCGKRLPIRSGSFFMRLQCSLLQALEMILAWCEDADCISSAEHFGVKPRVAAMVYDKLDELAVKEQSKLLLGGDNSVILAEMYPDCLNRLSPDTTDQPHVHRILMLADTNHIPTAYKLHVIRDELKKQSIISNDSQSLVVEVEGAVRAATTPQSLVVVSGNVPPLHTALPLQQLTHQADLDMQHFLTTRIWRQAITLCNASRDLCSGAGVTCAAAVQRYLHTALYRLRFGDGFYHHILQLIASEHTENDGPVSVNDESTSSSNELNVSC